MKITALFSGESLMWPTPRLGLGESLKAFHIKHESREKRCVARLA
jgi:hypothetical protein